jgi:hypothetical protein
MVDLYELTIPERRQFVRLFLDSLIHLPRELCRPTRLILDGYISTVRNADPAKPNRPRLGLGWHAAGRSHVLLRCSAAHSRQKRF